MSNTARLSSLLAFVLAAGVPAVGPCCRPADAQATPSGGVSVDSFSDGVTHPLKAGDIITATLLGSRSGRATFAIPGVVEGVRMKEVTPGDYTGAYTVPRNVSIVGGAVVGSLRYPGIASPLIPADNTVTIDSVPPHVFPLGVTGGATVASARPWIAAALSDSGGVGVDPATVHILLDAVDVTAQATVTPFSVGVTPAQPLASGAHSVTVSAADRLGNAQTARWNFTVAPNPPVQSFSGSFTPGQAVNVNQTIRFMLNAQGGCRARVCVGALAPNVPLGEGKPGVYTGEYTVQRGDGAGSVPVWAEFKTPGGQTLIVPLSGPLTVAAGPPRPPRITYPPIDDFLVGDTLDMEGQATPGATVRVTVNYVSKGLGGLFPIHGVASVKEVTADGKGVWRVERLSLNMPSLFERDQDTAFPITAVAVSPDGGLSSEAEVTARRG